ncbi:hypothetical protein [Streptomyces sp. NPDC057623]|uniref:hypothetical protein n=1 Tax=Streptomyces sp. NPDC057623 TaxID=3346187 RepID=UPI00369428A5
MSLPPPPFDLDSELDRIRAVQAGLGRRFVAVNAAAFVLPALLTAAGNGHLLAPRLPGGPAFGTLLCLAQATLLILTAWLYDRASRHHTDPRVDHVRAQITVPAGERRW